MDAFRTLTGEDELFFGPFYQSQSQTNLFSRQQHTQPVASLQPDCQPSASNFFLVYDSTEGSFARLTPG